MGDDDWKYSNKRNVIETLPIDGVVLGNALIKPLRKSF